MVAKDSTSNEQNTASGGGNNPPKPRKKLSKTAKYIINISIVLIITIAVVIFSVAGDFNQIMSSMSKAFTSGKSIGWFVGSIVLMVVSFAVDALVIFAFARLYTNHNTFGQATAAQSYKFFYDGIDPIQSAGKVMQANVLKKQGMPLASAASIMVMAFILNSVSLLAFETLSFGIMFKDIMDSSSNVVLFNQEISMLWPTILGFVVDISLIVFPLLFAYSKFFKNLVVKIIIPFLGKIKIIKEPQVTGEKAIVMIETFKIEMKRLFSNIPFSILIFFLYALSMLIKGMIPYFVAQSLQAVAPGSTITDFVFLSTFHQMIASALPLPGGSGGAEIFFTSLFRSHFENYETTIPAATILWRSITFTLPLIITGFIAAFYKSPSSIDLRDKSIYHTIASIQIATYEERKRSSDVIFETTELNRQAIHDRIFGKKINTDPLQGLVVKNESEVIVNFVSDKDKKRKQTDVVVKRRKNRKLDPNEWNEIDTYSK